MTIVNTVVKQVVHRAWNSIEPKLLAVAATGVSAAAVTEVADYLGITIQPALAVLVATILTAIAGYLKSSVVKKTVPADAQAKPATPPGERIPTPKPKMTPELAAETWPLAPIKVKEAPVATPVEEDTGTKYHFAQSHTTDVLPDGDVQTSIPDVPEPPAVAESAPDVVPAESQPSRPAPKQLPPITK